MRVSASIITVCLIVLLSACGGSGSQSNLVSLDASSNIETIRVFASDGNELTTKALSVSSTATEDGRQVELLVCDSTVIGCELAYDPLVEHVTQVVRGDYFLESDLYMTVTDVSGLIAIGGSQIIEGSRGSLLATIYLEAGAATDTRDVSELPTSPYCTPAEFDYSSDGTTATFNWIYFNAGDYDQNSEVNISDIMPIASSFGMTASGDSLLDYYVADGDLNGEVNSADITPIAMNYHASITGYFLEHSSEESGTFSAVRDVPLSNGTLDGRLAFSEEVTNATDGEWYRVSTYNAEDTSQCVSCSPLQVFLVSDDSRPTAVANATTLSGTSPLTVNFTADNSTDSDGSIVSYEWDLDGNGTFETDATANAGAAQYTYVDTGSYTVRLKVTDNDGYTDQDSLIIQVSNSASESPIAYAYATPAQGWAPLDVYVSGFMSNDPDGTITSWEWDFDGDGTFETSGTGDWGYASYTYDAGEYTATLRITDDSGNTATSSVDIEVRDPADSSVDYWNIFDTSQVKRVEISVSQENWDLMWADIQAETEVEADAVVFPGTALETSLTSCGFRMKGHSSLSTKSDKKPWKLDTNEFNEDQEFQNIKMLIFNNGYADPSLTREVLAYEMMQTAGVQAGNTCYVEVWISVEGAESEFWGLYTMVEEVGKKFLTNRFGNKKGNLYKCQSGSDLRYYGTDIAAYPTQDDGECSYQKETNEDEADYSDIINLCYVIDGQTYASPAEFSAAIEEVLNVDSFLRYLAVTLSHSNLDIFMYMSQNYYLYNNTDTGKFEWIPWDLNMAWGQFGDKTINEQCPLYTVTNPGGPSSTTNPKLFTQVLSVPAYRQTYAAYVDLLRHNYFTEANIAAKAESLHDLIEDSVAQGDKMFYGTNAEYTFDAFDQNWNTDWNGSSGGPGGQPGGGMFAFGVTSFTTTRCSYIDSHLLADL